MVLENFIILRPRAGQTFEPVVDLTVRFSSEYVLQSRKKRRTVRGHLGGEVPGVRVGSPRKKAHSVKDK